jgi:poly(3-hydroxybutyrate) depolymerase
MRAVLLTLALSSLGCGIDRAGGAGALGTDAGDASQGANGPADGADDDARVGADVDAASVPRCPVTSTGVSCAHEVASISDANGPRQVAYATPIGAAPSGGWPTVIYFQGSFLPGHSAFAAAPSDPLGMYELTLTIGAFLDRGYAVLAPDAASNGGTFWQTNIPPYSSSWPGCSDDVLMHNLFASIEKGAFGPLDASRLYAMGFSSGGFMTSRMAVSYAGRFRALADHSGSYATCGATCTVPTPLPPDHPPTLFLHGDADKVVPMSAVQPYIDALQAEGHVTKLVTDADAGHQWLAEAVGAVPDWFDAHP